jgi:L-aminopeptidase/D-esterase-like protein
MPHTPAFPILRVASCILHPASCILHSAFLDSRHTMQISRRRFGLHVGAAAVAAGGFARPASAQAPARAGSLTDVQGLRVGHYTDPRRPTGCTVLLFDEPPTAGVDYDGSAPGEHLGVMLQPVSPVDRVHAVLLTGGGPMGLDAVAGVVRYLEERGIGHRWGGPQVRVPIVLGAVIDDLSIGDGRIRPNPESAIKACEAASTEAVAEGSVGGGVRATVCKIFRSRGLPGMKGGIGTASIRRGEVVVAALAVVNAAGDIVDPASGAIVAGALTADGSGFARSRHLLVDDLGRTQALAIDDEPFRATTLTVIATNVALGKTSLTKLAMMANTGAARAVDPYHTNGDGDQVIALSTNRITRDDLSLTHIGAAAAEVAARAIVRGVQTAKGVEGWRGLGG